MSLETPHEHADHGEPMQPAQSLSELLPTLPQLRDAVLAHLPSMLSAVLVLLAGWMLALLLRGSVRRAFRALATKRPPGADRVSWTDAAGDQGSADIAAKGVYWLVLLTTLMIVAEALGFPVLSKWIVALTSYFPKIVVAIALVIGGVLGGRLAGSAVQQATTRMPPHQARSLARAARVSIVVAAVLIAAAQLGLDVSLLTAVFLILLAAGLGAGALAFGLGARQVIADILAMHYVLKSYRVGQVVRVGSDEGKIVRTTATAVLLENAEGEVAIPGRDFMESRCTVLNTGEDHGA